MKMITAALAATLALSPALAFAAEAFELKDGGKILVDEKGKTFHEDAKGKRVRMRDGVVMEGKDGQKYLMKNDAIWKQITEKGTLGPNR